ncbi:type III polyketide synthase [Nesterenkonia massiliensis]|uniref:Type III polyketide synthase n=2 Tax=Nesterenkonia massiliensis TaxID=1232429 RepID=A0ABT2HQN5_9MICC|nr:type III polyketide synthase [Nesterenkonia massiliensis]
MNARIVSIGTAVPGPAVLQERLQSFFADQPGASKLTKRLISAVFDAAAISTRHTVLSGFHSSSDLSSSADGVFIGQDGELLSPSTGVRNELFRQQAPALAEEAARDALAQGQVPASSVTHLVTVSCTGFFAPGVDFHLIRDLGLPGCVERVHLGFMGCAAAIPALRTAAHITANQPEAVVLVVCVELCSLHIRRSADPEQIVASSVFADGAAAAVVTADPARGTHRTLRLERFATALTEEGETDMVWTIGDAGFTMRLSAEVPRIVGREIQSAVKRLIGTSHSPSHWAVHPGGRSVLDRVERGLALDPAALEHSRAVLRERGNMSSATILFILQRILSDPEATGSLAALAFGPGLTVESALISIDQRDAA